MDNSSKFGFYGLFLIALAIVSLTAAIFARVPVGHRGVLVEWGKVNMERSLPEGFYLTFPLARNIRVMETRTQRLDMDAEAASKDMQDTQLFISLNYRLDGNKVNAIYQRLGHDFQKRVIVPNVNQIAKETTAQYPAESLLHNRSQVAKEIETKLRSKLGEYSILVESVSLSNIAFNEEYSNAIEQKAVAREILKKTEIQLETERVEAQKEVARAEGKAQAKIIDAEADARAIEVINKQLRSSPGYVQYMTAKAWDGKLPQVTGSSAIPIISNFSAG